MNEGNCDKRELVLTMSMSNAAIVSFIASVTGMSPEEVAASAITMTVKKFSC